MATARADTARTDKTQTAAAIGGTGGLATALRRAGTEATACERDFARGVRPGVVTGSPAPRPYPAGTFEKSPARHRGTDWARLSAGVRYRVAESFEDASGTRHRVGQTWTFLGFTLDGEDLRLWVSRDDRREWAIPFVASQRRESEVTFNLPRYLVEHDPPTGAERMADLLDEVLRAVEASEASLWATETPDELAVALRAHAASLRNDGTLASASDLHALFLPTGALQETSIDNGWGVRFVEWAGRVETLERRLNLEVARRNRDRERRRVRTRRTWRRARAAVLALAGLALVLAAAHLAGVLGLVLGALAILVALALLGAFGLAWLFSGGLFSRHPIRDAFRDTIASPAALAGVVVGLTLDAALLYWGVRTVAAWIGATV